MAVYQPRLLFLPGLEELRRLGSTAGVEGRMDLADVVTMEEATKGEEEEGDLMSAD